MKKLLFIPMLLVMATGHSQSWVWGKKGGAYDQLNTANVGFRPEEVYSLETDSQKNIYAMSIVGMTSLAIDGNPKTNYGDPTSKADVAIASFACDGTYRWSKIIGGQGREQFTGLGIDSQDNVYTAGKFGYSSYPPYPQHIDEDMVFPVEPYDNRRLVLIKYNNEGELQWYRKPEPTDVTAVISGGTSSKGFVTDSDGNCYWLVYLPTGNYADGSFVNEMEGSNWFVLKYNTEGSFINATYLDIQLTGLASANLKFFRNPNNGHFFISSIKEPNSDDDSAIIAGEAMANTMFLASFDASGNFLWKKENTGTMGGTTRIQNLVFDEQNNIYLCARMLGGMDTFMGYSFTFGASMVIMKLDPEADTLLWGTHYNHNGAFTAAIVLNNDEVGFTGYCYLENFTWGDQSIFASNPNEGTEVLLARFDKENGECLSLNKIPGNPGYNDSGVAIAVDIAGDYIVGGNFGNTLNFDNNAQLVIDGVQTDFFVAKYGLSTCECVMPEPDFNFLADEETKMAFNFTYTGSNYTSISWDFGGQGTSGEINPSFTFTQPGTYNVCVTVTNICGTETYCQEINATLGIATQELTGVKVYPNPVEDILTVTAQEDLSYTLYSLMGQEIAAGIITQNLQQIKINIPSGLYILKLQNNKGEAKEIKLIKE